MTTTKTKTTMKSANPYIEVNLQIDYDLLESQRCLCGDHKTMGQKMCLGCYGRLRTGQQAQLAGMQPGDGVANAVAGLVRRG
jgi:hypothetical protein